MSKGRNLLVLAAVAGLAWTAGRTGLLAGVESHAAPAPDLKQQDKDVNADMEAWAKAGAPSENHANLAQFIGEWEAEFTIWMEPGGEPFISTGTVTRDWVLGKRFVRERVEATSDFGSFNGLGYIGFNNFDGMYETAWMDDMSTGIHTETATYDPDTKIMTTNGTHRDPISGKLISSRSVVDMSSPDRHVFTSWMTGADGKDFKHMTGVSERK